MASYEQNSESKLWSVRFRENSNGDIKHKRLSGFRTKKEAQQAYIQYTKEAKEANKNINGLTFDKLIALYLDYLKTRVKDSSHYDISNKINKHITPYFEGKSVHGTQPVDILNWQKSIDAYSYAYKSNLRSLLSSIYKFGSRYYDVINIMEKVEGFRNLEPKKEMKFWTLEQFKIFIDCIDSFEYKMLFKFLYIAGCRKGEALALNWSDIDFKGKSVSITKNITNKVEGKAFEVTTPKNTSSNRIIDIPNSFCIELEQYREWQKTHFDNTEFVFGGSRPFAEQTVTRRFKEACKKADLPEIRIHDLRHSCASLLISEGISIVAVSRRLGHKNIEQTLNTYSHMMPSDTSKILNILENV